jgi:hypothetical protein
LPKVRLHAAATEQRSGEKASLVGKVKYDCLKCPGYCCSYPNIHAKPKDIKRLAEHFGISEEKAQKRFTKTGFKEKDMDKPPRVLRHQGDEHYGSICTFFDTEKRRCTVYEARPEICREYPGRKRCGYYEFLTHERDAQEDPDYVAITNNF